MHKDKFILVVGMGPGIGMAVCERFAKEGYGLVMLARSADRLSEFQSILKKRGFEAHSVVCDLAHEVELEKSLQNILKTYGVPQVVLYNAAVLTKTSPLTTPTHEVLRDFKVGVLGAVLCAQVLVPKMKGGSFLMTGGGFAYHPSADWFSLGLQKAGILNFTKSLTSVAEKQGVRVGTVTVDGPVDPGTSLSPLNIAEAFFSLHTQALGVSNEIILRNH